MSAPDSVLTSIGLAPVPAAKMLVTPTGGTQGELGDLLTTATGGAVSATTLTASSTVTLSPANKDVTIAPSGTGKAVIGPATAGTLDNMAIGGTTPLAGKFTTLTATDAVTLSPASHNIAISPTGTGTVTISPAGALTINPTAASTINNTSIGVTTPAAGKFTTITSATDGALTLTSQTDGASNKVGTLTNSPITGNPTVWVPCSVNGKSGWLPFWSA
jgi:hypothetical protein